MVIARSITELRYIDHFNNSKKRRWVSYESFYEIPRQKTLKDFLK